jgi:hypothetical protein
MELSYRYSALEDGVILGEVGVLAGLLREFWCVGDVQGRSGRAPLPGINCM